MKTVLKQLKCLKRKKKKKDELDNLQVGYSSIYLKGHRGREVA